MKVEKFLPMGESWILWEFDPEFPKENASLKRDMEFFPEISGSIISSSNSSK